MTKLRWRSVLFSIALLFLPKADAQSERVPTDQELKASYCFGYFSAQSDLRKSLSTRPRLCHGIAEEIEACEAMWSRMSAEQDDKLRRVEESQRISRSSRCRVLR